MLLITRLKPGVTEKKISQTLRHSRANEQMNQSPNDQSLREHLVSLLKEGNAHVSFDDFVKSFPVAKCGQRVPGLPYTAWQVLEHMRIAQWDILEFSRDGKHVSPKWPKGYWPDESQTVSRTPGLSNSFGTYSISFTPGFSQVNCAKLRFGNRFKRFPLLHDTSDHPAEAGCD